MGLLDTDFLVVQAHPWPPRTFVAPNGPYIGAGFKMLVAAHRDPAGTDRLAVLPMKLSRNRSGATGGP